jgi:hypothetical protein
LTNTLQRGYMVCHGGSELSLLVEWRCGECSDLPQSLRLLELRGRVNDCGLRWRAASKQPESTGLPQRNPNALNRKRVPGMIWERTSASPASGGAGGAVLRVVFMLKIGQKPEKTGKNLKKLWKQGFLLLTKPRESRKVNGGRFSQTRINTGLRGFKWMRRGKTWQRRDGSIRLAPNETGGKKEWQQH